MAAPINIDAYSDALVVLGTAGIVIPLMRRWGLNPVLGYLAAGALLGPLGLGSLISTFPFLYWVTVVDAKNVAGIAQLGVVFLLFLIGMELSYDRLKAMRRLVFGLGSLQVVLSTALIGGHRRSDREHDRCVDHPRRMPCIVVNGNSRRDPLQSGPPRYGCRSCQFLSSARTRPSGDPNPALCLHSRCRR